MGVYLSEPITEKKVKEGSGKGFTFCMAEMQGKAYMTQDGEKTWRMLRSMKWSWETATLSSQSLMATEVYL